MSISSRKSLILRLYCKPANPENADILCTADADHDNSEPCRYCREHAVFQCLFIYPFVYEHRRDPAWEIPCRDRSRRISVCIRCVNDFLQPKSLKGTHKRHTYFSVRTACVAVRTLSFFLTQTSYYCRNCPKIHLNVCFADTDNPKGALEINRYKLIIYRHTRSFQIAYEKEFRP